MTFYPEKFFIFSYVYFSLRRIIKYMVSYPHIHYMDPGYTMMENNIILVKKAENEALELLKKTKDYKDEQIMTAREECEKYIRRKENVADQIISTQKNDAIKSAERAAEIILDTAEKESEIIKSAQSNNVALSVRIIVSKITGTDDVLSFRNEPYYNRPP